MSALTVSDLAVEHELARVAESFRFILDVTPTNVEECRQEFLDGTYSNPQFTYRPLEDDPDVIAESLDAIPEHVEDKALARLLAAKRREFHLQLDLLRARDTADFLPLSVELYGGVDEELHARAEDVLEQIAVPTSASSVRITAGELAELAELELEHYRGVDPDVGIHVQVRPDVTGVMVEGHDLLVGADTSVHPDRVYPLLQHEVGTHLLTHVNGSHQPLKLLEVGLAGYEETQEGLAVLAEYLVGGLSPFRLRQLAARVIAVDLMQNEVGFADIHQSLIGYGFTPHSAFTTTMRVCRSGGLTKDAIYLRGLLNLLDHLAKGGTLDHLWLGKMSLGDLPVIDDLVDREVVVGPRILPRYLDAPATAGRLERAGKLRDYAQLTEGAI